jgi:pyrroline-5-carboxylate reductase
MGQALVRGLLAHGLSRRALLAADPNALTRSEVRRRFDLQVIDDNDRVVRQSDVIILAVKPQQVAEVLERIGPLVTRRHLVISIAAGVTVRWLQAWLPRVPIARVMPNLPATVGCGFSAITMGRAASPRHRAITCSLFRAVGDIVELPERYFDAITAVSGSGPAYVFFLAHVWEEAARSLGLPPAIASAAIRQTLDGSARLLRTAGEPASVLIGQVASKGGTTEAALKVLAKRRVSAHFAEALRAAARRSQTLSWS